MLTYERDMEKAVEGEEYLLLVHRDGMEARFLAWLIWQPDGAGVSTLRWTSTFDGSIIDWGAPYAFAELGDAPEFTG